MYIKMCAISSKLFIIIIELIITASCKNIFNAIKLDYKNGRGLNVEYNFDKHFYLEKMHSTPAARIFIEGCRGFYSGFNDSGIIPLENTEELIIFGIFTLDVFSILLYYEHNNDTETAEENMNRYVNITLGANENSYASICGTGMGNDECFVNDHRPNIPIMPYYISISASKSKKEVQVFELRLGERPPFLKYSFTESNLEPKNFRIHHERAIYAHHSCCEAKCRRQVFHRISGCNEYITRTDRIKDKFNLTWYDMPLQGESEFMFNGNFIINYPENKTFGAKFKFFQYNDQPGDYYEIALTDHPVIWHYIFPENFTANVSSTDVLELSVPMTINITISKNGHVSLTRTHETKPFLTYHARQKSKRPVNVRFMSMAKLYDDYIRYDLYHNCTDVLTYFNESVPKLSATRIIKKFVNRLNETRYDFVRIYNETFHMNDKFGKSINAENQEFDDVDYVKVENLLPILDLNNNSTGSKTGESQSFLDKALAAVGSIILVGVLKFFASLDSVKTLIGDHDKDKLKGYGNNIKTNIEDHGFVKYLKDAVVSSDENI